MANEDSMFAEAVKAGQRVAEDCEVSIVLVEALRLDLVGPSNDHAFAREGLPDHPQQWYATGFLLPRAAPSDIRSGPHSLYFKCQDCGKNTTILSQCWTPRCKPRLEPREGGFFFRICEACGTERPYFRNPAPKVVPG